jgi:hypothetical protein
MGVISAEITQDMYRIANVFRGTKATVIMLPDRTHGKSRAVSDTEHGIFGSNAEWVNWGDRIWTFPEALLGKALYYKIGDGRTTDIDLRQLTNTAFRSVDRKEAVAVIDHYSGRGKDVLSRLQSLSC